MHHQPPSLSLRRLEGSDFEQNRKASAFFVPLPSVPAGLLRVGHLDLDWMAHAAVKPCCVVVGVVTVLAVAVLLAMPQPAAAAVSSSSREAAALQRPETAAMYTAQDLREKPDVTKGTEEDVTTTGFGAESEREVPTGPDPIHHHGRGPRRQSP
ncbi:hypothetical protein GUJ93_ZPchr0014g47387 [Zizania palustris]|uniref:Uncharacterized protein n=1 Tax=Zizania palustris TaxID=103762 RepID=A0A8J5SW80_ZIZPA|nr:hypothetical protein GUJ93_ZPchr0014g47387 [Zizania palustris]